MNTSKRKRAFIASAICLVFCCRLFALNPSLDISQYAHKSWKVRDGFFKGSITTIQQTPDGYLWIGTEFGLCRFDGVRIVPWQPGGKERLPSTVIRQLFVSKAFHIADRVAMLYQGRLIAVDKKEQFVHNNHARIRQFLDRQPDALPKVAAEEFITSYLRGSSHDR